MKYENEQIKMVFVRTRKKHSSDIKKMYRKVPHLQVGVPLPLRHSKGPGDRKDGSKDNGRWRVVSLPNLWEDEWSVVRDRINGEVVPVVDYIRGADGCAVMSI